MWRIPISLRGSLWPYQTATSYLQSHPNQVSAPINAMDMPFMQ